MTHESKTETVYHYVVTAYEEMKLIRLGLYQSEFEKRPTERHQGTLDR
nr:hypothetical protein CPGR_02531 [Mycolicibacterium malmesburyense]